MSGEKPEWDFPLLSYVSLPPSTSPMYIRAEVLDQGSANPLGPWGRLAPMYIKHRSSHIS